MNPTQPACQHVRKRGNFCADCGARIDARSPAEPADGFMGRHGWLIIVFIVFFAIGVLSTAWY